MFSLTMTVWFLVHGVGTPVQGDTYPKLRTFSSRCECEAMGRADQWLIAKAVQDRFDVTGDNSVHQIEATCTANGWVI